MDQECAAAGRRCLVIAGTGSGAGKTTVTLGIMAALRGKGLKVQGFKCGPDYIDPTYHKAVTGRPSRNLDSWMFGAEAVRELYERASADADLAVIEGVMGFYDGKDPKSNVGSTAEISLLLGSPVLLVVNCQSMARSAAAIVKGFQLLDPRVRIAAVFANKVGSAGHYRIVKEAIEQECGVPVIGYLLREEALSVPERHLGLVPSIERGELGGFFDALAERLQQTTDMDKLLELSELADELGLPPSPANRIFAEPARKYPVTLLSPATPRSISTTRKISSCWSCTAPGCASSRRWPGSRCRRMRAACTSEAASPRSLPSGSARKPRSPNRSGGRWSKACRRWPSAAASCT